MQEEEQKTLTTHEILSQKAKENLEKRRRAGYERWLKKKHKEMEKRKEKEREKKEKERERKRIEREKLKEEGEIKLSRKKPGRPKKRGPKKKRKSRAKKVYKERKTWDFKIISFHNGKQHGYHGVFYDSQSAYEKMDELLKENKRIIFPKKVENNEIMGSSRYEYIILEKNRYGDKKDIDQRNEFGKLVKQRTNSSKWVVFDKFPCDVEETFWVWGFNPNTERKTFQWIYENIIMSGLVTKYDMKRVYLYKNKILIKDDGNNLDMVLCKTPGDSIRFYNLIEEWNKTHKNKQVIMLGSLNIPGERKRKTEDEIMELTGWARNKVQQSYTKKHTKK